MKLLLQLAISGWQWAHLSQQKSRIHLRLLPLQKLANQLFQILSFFINFFLLSFLRYFIKFILLHVRFGLSDAVVDLDVEPVDGGLEAFT